MILFCAKEPIAFSTPKIHHSIHFFIMYFFEVLFFTNQIREGLRHASCGPNLRFQWSSFGGVLTEEERARPGHEISAMSAQLSTNTSKNHRPVHPFSLHRKNGELSFGLIFLPEVCKKCCPPIPHTEGIRDGHAHGLRP